MEKTLLQSIEDWQNWYSNKVNAWGCSRRVRAWGESETPNEYPCLVIEVENEDEGYAFSCYDFVYKSDVANLFV